MPDGISIKSFIIRDMDRIALVYFIGRFTKDQAKEVIPIFSKYADREANKRDLAEHAGGVALKIQERGAGGLIWIDWPTVRTSKLKFWK